MLVVPLSVYSVVSEQLAHFHLLGPDEHSQSKTPQIYHLR